MDLAMICFEISPSSSCINTTQTLFHSDKSPVDVKEDIDTHTRTRVMKTRSKTIYIHTYILYINAKITSPILSSFIIEAMRI